MSFEKNKTHNQTVSHGSITSYVIGFLLSLGLTYAAYYLVTTNVIENPMLIPSILALAFLQLLVQLFYFLHLGQEKRPRWNLAFFLLTAITIMTVVVGALWIMQHLNANMMPEQVEDYILHDEGLKTEKGY
jgi:cytochrome o ubiquinol oxidase subunit IV